ncbi:hypothetical protein [Rhizobium leguminosarum]|uniref:Uncharacterized protein n=1 Tax=Rhizobium leguminosarum TaxID=384 RepID=A0A1B1CJK7_RHILE|nr:hypothetical protein [Rhizobium leguminosarum]ANP89952.1 hypothetical protein BA011_30265 [Rhizobium leguminosarum]
MKQQKRILVNNPRKLDYDQVRAIYASALARPQASEPAMTPSSDDQPEFSQMLPRMSQMWRSNIEQAGEVGKSSSNR